MCFPNFLKIQPFGLNDTLLYLAYGGDSGTLLLNFVNSTFTSSTMGGRRTRNRQASAMEQENDASDVEGNDHPVPPTSHSTAGAVSDGINKIEDLLKSLSNNSGNNVGVRMENFDGLPSSNATGWLQKFRSYVHLNG